MDANLPSRVRSDLLAGFLVVVPIGITFWVFFALVDLADGLIRALPLVLQPETHLGFPIPGLGVLLTFLVVFLVGLALRNYAGQRAVEWLEGVLARVPLASSIYHGIKQVMETVAANRGEQFRQVVLLEYPRKEIYCLAFVTNQRHFLAIEGAAESETMVSVFLPTTPNPTSGFYLLVPQSELRKVDLTVEEAFKLIMSAGIVTPAEVRAADHWGDAAATSTQAGSPVAEQPEPVHGGPLGLRDDQVVEEPQAQE
jgi:uncharacterized membrane protein